MSLADQYRDIITTCRDLLLHYDEAFEARRYLDSRLSKEIQEKFGFGFFPTKEHFSAFTCSFPEETLIKSNLRYEKVSNFGIYQKTKVNFFEHHNIVMPYRSVYGDVVAMVGRTIFDSKRQQELGIPKYKNTSFEKRRHLFGLYEGKTSIQRRDGVIVVEGQFDCIRAHQSGIENVVALGSSNMTTYQLALIKRYTDNIYLLLDNDEGGRTGTERIVKKFGKLANIKAKVIPQGFKDLDELLCNNNIDYKELIEL